ncbi:MAG: hypothetical protein E4H10_04005 [Bacteroidia bacterium]|nr:MAG: hypothetical protein E4H10_04005 [Bacteroidia bacterium]
MSNRAGGLFEVVWFVLGGLLLIMGVDITTGSGIGESWYYFLFSLLAFAMYFFRRRMRLKHK